MSQEKLDFYKWLERADLLTQNEYQDLGFHPENEKSMNPFSSFARGQRKQVEFIKKFKKMDRASEKVELERRFSRISTLFNKMDRGMFEDVWRDLSGKDGSESRLARRTARSLQQMGILVAPSPDSDDQERAQFFKPGEVIVYKPEHYEKYFTSNVDLTEKNGTNYRQEFTVEEPVVWAKLIDSYGQPHFKQLNRGWLEPVQKN